MKLTVEIDDQIANDAREVFDALGLDMDIAIRMFLKRAALEQRLPLSMSVSGTAVVDSPSEPTRRTKNVITKAMAEDIWRRFQAYQAEGGSINAVAADAHSVTGMNQGSAFIYLTILDNLVNGKHNTRNMKIADLEFYMDRIREELDDASYANAIESLKLSIPYWDKEEFGQFASKVRSYLNSLD